MKTKITKTQLANAFKKGTIIECGNCKKRLHPVKAWKTTNEPMFKWLCKECFDKWCEGDIGTPTGTMRVK